MVATAEEIQRIRDMAANAIGKMEAMLNLDTATGIWLDWLGQRLGIPRPATTDPAQDTRFGFDDAGVGFDQAPYSGDTANDRVFPLPDEAYRRLIKARAVTVLFDGTSTMFTRAVRHLDPGSSVQDRRDMSIRIVTSERMLLELADQCGALPVPAGVNIEYADRGAFGFDDAGAGFDQGPYGGT